MSDYTHVIAGSGGNDSRELVRWCLEHREAHGIDRPVVAYIDTGWAWCEWQVQLDWFRGWVEGQGVPFVVVGPGSMGGVIDRYGYHSPPLRKAPFCSHRLKRWPMVHWLESWDTECQSVQVRGIRREESNNRSTAPEWVGGTGPVDWRAVSEKTARLKAAEGQRDFWCPMVRLLRSERDARLSRAALPIFRGPEGGDRRSRECKCLSSKKADIREMADADRAEIRDLEADQTAKRTAAGKPGPFSFFVPSEHGGQVGIDAVYRWAHTDRGRKYDARQLSWCDAGLCGT